MHQLPISRLASLAEVSASPAPLVASKGRTDGKSLLVNLNALRAVAALAVVYSHITSEAGLDLSPNIGSRGVDIFFVISGFIIAYIGSKNPRNFFVRRLIRIVPFYWAATLVVFAIVLTFPQLLRSTQPDFVQLIYSLLFIPRETSYAGLYPTLVLGWSLNYEMYFYVWFAISMLLSRRFAPLVCCAAISIVALLIDLSRTEHSSINFYARPIVFEFIFGIIAYYLCTWLERRHKDTGLKVLGKPLLLFILSAALLSIFAIEHAEFGLPRYIGAGIPAFIIISSAILLERLHGLAFNSRLILLLGEASYILYLIHPYIVYGVLRLVFGQAVPTNPILIVLIVASLMSVSGAVAIAAHLIFEKPMIEFLRRRLLR